MCIVEILGLNRNVIVVSMYQPPDYDAKAFLEHCSSLLSVVCTEKQKDIIVGTDHNFDLLKCGIHQ